MQTRNKSLGPPRRVPIAAPDALHGLRREDVEMLVGHRVNDMNVYREAFVHKSMHRSVGVCCERLELLGDAVLNLVVAHLLLERFPNSTEGFITRVRVKLVAGKQLAKFARALELNRWVVLSQSARSLGIANNDRTFEDVFEAFVGALFMDMGFDACLAFVDGVVHKHVDLDDLVIESNFKDLLARYAQQHGMGAVEYEITEVHGPAHKRSFTTRAKIDGCAIGEGTAASKKESEMLAARHSLHVLDVAVTTPIAGGR